MPRMQELVREARKQGVPEDQWLNWALDRWQQENSQNANAGTQRGFYETHDGELAIGIVKG